jgi:riboflavin biosynthesis pyrimidine reductase
LPAELERRYGGDLRFPDPPRDRPYVIGNFVSTLDGIISFNLPGKRGGGEISGHDDGDRFIMGLLRASADAVMIGSGTLHATDPAHVWTPEAVYREAKELYASYRKDVLGMAQPPMAVIVSGSGIVDLDRPMFRKGKTPVCILTTAEGAERLKKAGAASLPATEVCVPDSAAGAIGPGAMLAALAGKHRVRLLLHEGGPTLYAEFLAAGLVDESFLTLAPQVAGSDAERPRPTMVWGTEFLPENAPWARILSVKQGGEHLYLRYGWGLESR